jgi:hypothetical protein
MPLPSTSRSSRGSVLTKVNVRACLVLLGLTAARGASAANDPHGNLAAAGAEVAQKPEDEAPRMSTQELRQTLPDLNLRESPPSVLFAAQFGMHIPYQVLGVGLGVDLYPARWLRLGALYSFGFSPTGTDAVGSHYAEAVLGVAVFDSIADRAVELTTRAIPYADPVTLNTFVPSSRALFVEGGALTGFFSPTRCTANCRAEGAQKTLVADDRQFVVPFVGLRYVSYYRASSEHAGFQKRSYLQIYAHAFGKALNAPDHPIYDHKGDSFDNGWFGGRVGIDTPPFSNCLADVVLHTGCAQGGLALGYTPAPGFAFFEFHISYLID